MIKHITKEGSRRHVLRWDTINGERCSEEDCEINHRKKMPEEIRLQMEFDAMICGNGFCSRDENGNYERINPTKVTINEKGEVGIENN